jgi:lipopolysaccharide/colanic/teichoic acid biosynthesis glycosyltransferase
MGGAFTGKSHICVSGDTMADFTSSVYFPFVRLSDKPPKKFLIRLDRFLSRCLDIIIAATGLIFLSPFFILIGIRIMRETPGPVFFKGLRLGRFGREFRIYKFRTMYEDPTSYQGTRVTANGDGRITPLGHWLRDTKINELPQLWNVLIGDMSLVGPRPEDCELALEWPEDVRSQLLSVRPGITSPASIVYHDEEKLLEGASFMEDYFHTILPSKLRLDLLYIKNRSIFTDLDIIFWTGITLLPTLRNKPIPSRLLYFGPLSQFMSRFMNWFVVDFFLSLTAVWMGGLIWRAFGPINVGIFTSFLASFGFAFCFSLINLLFGLNRISWSKARAQTALDLVFSSAFAVGIMLIFNQFISKTPLYPTGMFVISGMVAAALFITVRYRERLITSLMSRWVKARHVAGAVGERVLVVGAGEMGEFATWFFGRGDFVHAFSVVGFIDDDPRLGNIVVAGKTVIGSSDEIPKIVERHDVGVIIFAITNIDEAQRKRIIDICLGTRARLVMFPDLMAIIKDCLVTLEEPGKISNAMPMPERALDQASVTGFLTQLDELIAEGKTIEARESIIHYKESL